MTTELRNIEIFLPLAQELRFGRIANRAKREHRHEVDRLRNQLAVAAGDVLVLREQVRILNGPKKRPANSVRAGRCLLRLRRGVVRLLPVGGRAGARPTR